MTLFYILSSIIISYFCIFLFQTKLSQFLESEIDAVVKKRIEDYQDLFQYIETIYDNPKYLEDINNLANKNIYLDKRGVISLGVIESKILSSFDSEKLLILKQNPRNVVCSKAFLDLNIINEPLIELTYLFLSKKNDWILLSAVILAQDILFYSSNYIKFALTEELKSENKYFFCPSLGTHLLIEKPDNSYYTILLIVTLSLIQCFILLYFKYRRCKSILSLHIVKTKKLAHYNNHLIKLNNFLRKTAETVEPLTHKDIFPLKIITELISIHELKLKEKKITIKLDDIHTDVSFAGKSNEWNILLGNIVESLISMSPPKSSISCHTLEEDYVTQIVFKDESPVSYEFTNKIPTNEFDCISVPKCNLEQLLSQMNVYMNVSFSEDKGNTISLAISNKNDTNSKEKSNVVFLSR